MKAIARKLASERFVCIIVVAVYLIASSSRWDRCKVGSDRYASEVSLYKGSAKRMNSYGISMGGSMRTRCSHCRTLHTTWGSFLMNHLLQDTGSGCIAL